LPEISILNGLPEDGPAHFKLLEKTERLALHDDEPQHHVVHVLSMAVDREVVVLRIGSSSAGLLRLERISDGLANEPTAFQILAEVEVLAAVG
jgi:hypothetical protein